MTPTLRSRAEALLSRFYGYRTFRPGQFEVIEAVMSGRDALVIMPTGGGKSICYQLPALLSDGCAVVVSPLIALMQDQTQGLIANGIPAAALHSNQHESDNSSIFAAAANGRIKVLYVSPERLLSDFNSFLALNISLFAIDEAHCISQWGHDFRQVYTQLAEIKNRFPSVPVMALTATADKLTRCDIANHLHLNNPFCFLSSFDRPNISLAVYANPGAKGRIRFIQDMVRKYPQDSGIVYCLSRNGAEDAAAALSALGIPTACYHAGLSPFARDNALRRFLSGEARVVCATIAFGMGIDKSNIRWVIHANMPGNIESYYQEIGRAGRDGMPAEAIMFYSLQDVIMRRKFVDESGQPAINREKLARMQAFAEARVCRRRILLNYFSEENNCDCGNCDNCKRPRERFDGSVLVQKAVSAVMRTGQRIGLRTLIGILRGMAHHDIRMAGYDHLPTFGVGADLAEDQWLDYITQMVQLGIFEIAYNEYNHLKTTPYGLSVMRGHESLTLSVYTGVERGSKKASKPLPTARSAEEQLFEQLKSVRADISRMQNLQPHLIFSDATLMDMARRRPVDTETLLEVSGVGEKKAVQFGKRFIREIRRFEGLGAQPQGASVKETLILFNAGCPVDEIARIKNIKPTTVYSHFAQLIDMDMITAYHAIIKAQDYKYITDYLRKNPDSMADLATKYPHGLLSVALSISRAVDRKKTGSGLS